MVDMCSPASSHLQFAATPIAASFRWRDAAIWVVVAALSGGAMAWIAFVAEPPLRAPFVIFPLLIGAVLGGLLVLLVRAMQIGHRPTLLCGGVVAVAIAVVGQHYFSHRKARQDFEASSQRAPQLQVFFPEKSPPERFFDFMAQRSAEGRDVLGFHTQGVWAWLSWAFDAMLVLLPAALLVGSAARLPFCRTCGRWFRTTRGGKIPVPAGRELAALIDATIPADARAVKFRLSSCLGGCGPTGLAVFWEQTDADYTSGTVWLDAEGRDRVAALLDAAQAPAAETDLSTDSATESD
jgi:hypothetical protein